jgi:drug resistance transporter, EmrB/QacA subfamily
LGIFCGLFLSGINQSIVGTAMPRIAGEIGGFALYAWVSVAYLIAAAVSGPIGGKLSDLLGRKPIYLASLVLFLIGALACGFASTMGELIAFRAIQGIGGGILFPLVSTILGDSFPAKERGKWMGLFAVVSTVAQIVGPLVGGLLVDALSWHWVFFVMIPLGLLVLVLVTIGFGAQNRVAARGDASGAVHVDYLGASMMTIGTVALLLALSIGGRSLGWGSWQVVGLFVVAVVFWVGFVAVEGRAVDPLIGNDLFHSRDFVIACLVGFVSNVALFGVINYFPLYLQGAMGVSATESGFVLAPMMLGVMIAAQACGALTSKTGAKPLFLCGFVLQAVGLGLLAFMPPSSSVAGFVVAITLCGLGAGALTPTVLLVAQQAFEKGKRGIATSTTQFCRTLGSTIGVAVFGSVLNATSSSLIAKNVVPRIKELSSELGSDTVQALVSKASSDPQGLFTQLLSPTAAASLSAHAREALLPPLRTCLAQSIQVILIIAALVSALGIAISALASRGRRADGTAASE